uniref:NADH dehydrogenase [ubiquinone] 1 alpha subcomplex subunit 2 n=2 Tax=Anas TaxID=8835 RepID=A0A493TL09_ANAPP
AATAPGPGAPRGAPSLQLQEAASEPQDPPLQPSPTQPSPAQHSLVEGVRVVHIVPIGGQRVGERLTCGDRGRAALRDPSAGVGRRAPPPPQHEPSPGGGTETTPEGAPRCHDAVATLSRCCHDATPPALTVPLRHLGRAPLPSAAAQEVPEAPLAPRPTLPSPLSDWPTPSGGARRLASPAPRPRPSSGRAHKMAAAAVRGIGAGLGRGVRELRLHLCQSSAGSRGVREFIEQHYVALKQANPGFPILIRECSGVRPRLWARYEFGKEKSVSLDNLSVDEVAKALENIVKSKA